MAGRKIARGKFEPFFLHISSAIAFVKTYVLGWFLINLKREKKIH